MLEHAHGQITGTIMSEADAMARRVADALLQREGTGPAWGIVIDEAREGYARIRMTVRNDMLNGHRSAHGGMIFALADTAFAYACNSRNETTVAQSAAIAFLAPAGAGDVLVAEAREASRAGRSGVYQVSVRTADARAVAEFTGLSRTIGGAVIN
jgi:acyl-CoA thioesterase